MSTDGAVQRKHCVDSREASCEVAKDYETLKSAIECN